MAISSRKGGTGTRKFQVKIKVISLEGFMMMDYQTSARLVVEIKWDGNYKYGFSSLYRKYHNHQQGGNFLTREILVMKMGQLIEWNHEFHHVCNLIAKNDGLFASSMVNFNLLYGDNEEPCSSTSIRAKMKVIGKGGLNIGELASIIMEPQIPQKVPISIELDGVAMEANLTVILSFNEMKNSGHSRGMSIDSFGAEQNSNDVTKMLRKAKSHGPTSLLGQEKGKKNMLQSLFGRQMSWKTNNKGSDDSEYVIVASGSRLGEPGSATESSEAQLDMTKKGRFFKWKRRKSMKKVVTPDIPKQPEVKKTSKRGTWQTKEIESRDGKTKLNAKLFFASYDQRSENARGESACAAIVVVIAHWLQENPNKMPSGPDLDRLITEGSTKWQKLCKDETNKDFFPDHHYDLETILKSELRPLIVLPHHSHFGFFHPEEFDHLKGVKSFDEIWDDINKDVNDFESKIYIVRWNDHFFIMKIEGKANYIIDSLGERLYEGCNQAYILKFDDSSEMYTKEDGNEGGNKVICKGKECCREYMKRFLAAISVRELKEQEVKGERVEMVVLNRRLLIDFHLSTPSSSTASTSRAGSPNTSPLLLGDHDDLNVSI